MNACDVWLWHIVCDAGKDKHFVFEAGVVKPAFNAKDAVFMFQ